MKLIKINAIDSTNDYLKSLNRKVALEDGVVVVANSQTHGRGQAGTHWYSEAGKSLTFSMFRRFQCLAADRQFAISCAVALGLKKGLEQLDTDDVKIKWPNDILAGGKKVCGILIENQVQAGMIVSAVVGVGMNINNSSIPKVPNASSLALLSGKNFETGAVLEKVVACISSEMERLDATDFKGLLADYENDLFRINTLSEFEDQKGKRWKAIIKGVSESGLLGLEMENSSTQWYSMKDLKLLY